MEMEEYLTTTELSERIKMAPGTIRNLMWKGVLKEGEHFFKPTSRKILFDWRAVNAWIRTKNNDGENETARIPEGCRINLS